MAEETLTTEQRRDILNRDVAKYVKRGFRVVHQTDTTAQLVKPKKFSFLWALLWFLVFGVGILVYIFYYMAKRDETIYLAVDERGKVRATKGKK